MQIDWLIGRQLQLQVPLHYATLLLQLQMQIYHATLHYTNYT